MADSILQSYASAFSANVSRLAGQVDHRLAGKVNLETLNGVESKSIPLLGTVSAQKITDRAGDTIAQDQPWVNAYLPVDGYNVTFLVPEQDPLNTLYEPTNPLVQRTVHALNDKKDSVIAEAATGVALRGKTGSTAVALPDAQKVAVNFGGSNVGMTLAKVIEARRILRASDAFMDGEETVLVYGAQQMADLLAVAQVTSTDYVPLQALARGDITSFMGFNFIQYNGLALDASDYRTCFAFAKSGITLGIQRDIDVKIDTRPEKQHATQIRSTLYCGATRTDDEKVVEITCDESP